MRIITDRKRAVGLGAAHAGTEHHWNMIVTSFALIGLVPLFIFTFGSALGGTYEEVVAYYQKPFPAIVAILTVVVGLVHFRNGAQVLIEDYTHGLNRKVLILLMVSLCYTLIAAGLYAIVRIAL